MGAVPDVVAVNVVGDVATTMTVVKTAKIAGTVLDWRGNVHVKSFVAHAQENRMVYVMGV